MNELEKQIEAQKVEPTCWRDQGYNSGFHCGANFILEKNLPVLFADFLSSNFIWFGSGIWEKRTTCKYELDFTVYHTNDIYDYWLNNVYGK